MKILIINGKGTCGKDTFIDFLKNHCNLYQWSSIDLIKKIALDYFDWDGLKDDAGRKLLSDLKLASVAYNDLPLRDMKTHVKNAKYLNKDLFIAVIRDIPEIEKVLKDEFFKDYDIKTLLIKRKSLEDKIYGNSADDNVDLYDYNYCISNDGTIKDLEVKALSLINTLGIKKKGIK